VSGSVELREAVLRERLDRAELLIAALARALYDATRTVVCTNCFRVHATEHCPHCTGLEGKAQR
jgi:recombinational DNA repair protein RecR